MMKNTTADRELRWGILLMFLSNLALILYYSMLCTATTYRVCGAFGAYDFLRSVGQLPPRPWLMPVLGLGLFLLLWVVSFGKYRLEVDGFWPRLMVCVTEFLLSLGVTAALRFYYSGIALLVLADLVYYVRNSLYRTCFMLILIVQFAFARFEIVTPGGVSLGAYLGYYDQRTQGYLTGILSVESSVNILLFVLFMILLFTRQKRETLRIQQLNQANTQLKEYAAELEHMTAMRERNRLAREIHDTLGHTLTGIIMAAQASLAIFEAAPEESKKRLEVIAQSAQDRLGDVRRSIKALRPDALEKHTLDGALTELVEKFRLSASIEIDYQQLAGPLKFAQDEEDALYRVVQESLTNAVRHGKATRVRVALTRMEDTFTILILDNGKGCPSPEAGFGLRHMDERLKMLGGSLAYGNMEHQRDGYGGFFVNAAIPIREGEENE